jgi:dUTP pyrophosphatase
MIKIKFKKQSENAKMPTKATEHSAGWDLYAYLHEDIFGYRFRSIPIGGRVSVDCGIALEIPEGFEGQIRPRSGLALKEGAVCAFGTIDSDYRGYISVILFNLSYSPIRIENHQRIAQLVLQPVIDISFEEVSELSVTDRGSKGFGSSGR